MKFAELGFHPLIEKGIELSGFTDCTPVQEACMPPILHGKDVSGLAQTGTGKTAAFLLPIMDRIVRSQNAGLSEAKPEVAATQATKTETTDPEKLAENVESNDSETPEAEIHASQSAEKLPEEEGEGEAKAIEARPIFKDWKGQHFILILVPTRELAQQIHQNVEDLGKPAGFKAAAVFGGASHEGQKAAIRGGVQFIVATPGRLIDLFKDHALDLSQVRAVIFDEADRMFDMGFKDDMKYILRRIPRDRQFLMFSATINFDVLSTAYEFGAEPIEIDISRDQPKAENVKDEIFHAGMDEKPAHLLSLLKVHKPGQAIVFSNFKRNVEKLALFLNKNGYDSSGISSLLNQAQRTRVINQFKAEDSVKCILVATDVAARGLDIKGVDLVINYELPDDPENYVHRIGRTGRAGCEGKALSLVSEKDVESLGRIETYLGHKLDVGWIESDDLVTELKSFPTERELEKLGSYSKSKRPSDGNRSGGRRPDRNSSRGSSRDKRDFKAKTPSRDNKKRPDPKEQRVQSDKDGEAESNRQNEQRPRQNGEGQNRGTHRDRKSGRHRTRNTSEKPANRSSQEKEPEQQAKSGDAARRQQRRGPKSVHRPRKTGAGNEARSSQFKRRPLKKKDSEAASSKTADSVSSKVAGFFKKLFS